MGREGYRIVQHRVNGLTVSFDLFQDARAVSDALNRQEAERAKLVGMDVFPRQRAYWVQESGA